MEHGCRGDGLEEAAQLERSRFGLLRCHDFNAHKLAYCARRAYQFRIPVGSNQHDAQVQRISCLCLSACFTSSCISCLFPCIMLVFVWLFVQCVYLFCLCWWWRDLFETRGPSGVHQYSCALSQGLWDLTARSLHNVGVI